MICKNGMFFITLERCLRLPPHGFALVRQSRHPPAFDLADTRTSTVRFNITRPFWDSLLNFRCYATADDAWLDCAAHGRTTTSSGLPHRIVAARRTPRVLQRCECVQEHDVIVSHVSITMASLKPSKVLAKLAIHLTY